MKLFEIIKYFTEIRWGIYHIKTQSWEKIYKDIMICIPKTNTTRSRGMQIGLYFKYTFLQTSVWVYLIKTKHGFSKRTEKRTKKKKKGENIF